MAKPQRDFRNQGTPFDPLQYVKRLEAVGFTREQAETQAETFLTIVQEQLVTKQDLKEVEAQLVQKIKELEVSTTHQIRELEAKTTLETELLKRDLKIWFGGMLVTLVVVMSGIMAVIVHLGGRG